MRANGRRASAVSILACSLLAACGGQGGPTPSPSPSPTTQAERAPSPVDPFDAWLAADYPPADGFEAAVRGREIEVRAVASGRVAHAADEGPPWNQVVMIDHVFYENHERREIRSVYSPLGSTRVRSGAIVKRGEVIGTLERGPVGATAARFRLQLRWDKTLPATFMVPRPAPDDAWTRQRYVDPAAFIRSHRRLAVPQEEPALLLVSTLQRKVRVRLQGERVGDFEVGFGQKEGRKHLQHDLRTPLGQYFVVAKSRGPFPGAYGGYYGGHWIKVNYPNGYDADWGRRQGIVGRNAASRIAQAWSQRRPTAQDTALGGGIGLHGWLDDWDLEGSRRLSWGCVVMRNADIRQLFDRVPLGAMVVIF
jgi:hypothetical protein